jgi:PAS domain S-box-containing protein
LIKPVEKKVVPPDPRVWLAAIVESSDDAIISKDLNSVITSWNKGAERIFGYREAEIVGKSILTIIPQELQHEEPEIIRKLCRGDRVDHYETERLRKDGQRINVSLTISPIFNSKGEVIAASKIARDITQLKLAQNALIESEKLAVAGRFAASIAHEINNPLAAIINLAYLLERDQSLGDTARLYAKMLLDELGRISDITRKTLAFYQDTSELAEIDLAALIEEIVSMHEVQFANKRINLVRKLDTSARIWGSFLELRQVFLNLLLNAFDAVAGPGEITIRVKKLPSRVRVSVCDNGTGIPQEIRDRIFEPFFSTKPGSGTGLGLWISKGIINKHKGKISARSSTSSLLHGTTFVVDLPLKSD